jgi:hypothetical protein
MLLKEKDAEKAPKSKKKTATSDCKNMSRTDQILRRIESAQESHLNKTYILLQFA